MIPSGQKKADVYQEAYERAAYWYKRYPQLKAIDDDIAKCLASIETDGNSNNASKLNTLKKQHNDFIKSNDVPLDYKSPNFECNICKDSGWVEVVDQNSSERYGYEITRMKKCVCLLKAEKQKVINRYFNASRLTPVMKRQTFNRFRLDVYSDIEYFHGLTHREIMKTNCDIAQEFVVKMDQVTRGIQGLDVKGLYLEGQPGVGKTFLCSAIANSLLKRNVPVLYLPYVDFMQQLRGAISDDSRRTDDYINTARDVDVLILDDLGSESITDFSQEVLFTIINYRTGVLNKPVIISSNYSLNELSSMYHPRITSRIKRSCYTLNCVGDDLREILK